MGAPEVKPLLSDEHFSVDGTLLQAWASHASLERADGQQDLPLIEGFRRLTGAQIQRSHGSAELSGPCAHGQPPCPDRRLPRHPSGAHQKTVGADKGYDIKGFVAEMRRIGTTPQVAQNTARAGGSAFDGRTTRHEGYAMSMNARRRIEKVFAWIKKKSSPQE